MLGQKGRSDLQGQRGRLGEVSDWRMTGWEEECPSSKPPKTTSEPHHLTREELQGPRKSMLCVCVKIM